MDDDAMKEFTNVDAQGVNGMLLEGENDEGADVGLKLNIGGSSANENNIDKSNVDDNKTENDDSAQILTNDL